MNYKKLLLNISIIIIVVFSLMALTSYAYYTFSGATTAFEINTYNEYIDVTFESSEIINISNAIPINDDEIEESASSNNFTVNVVGNSGVAEVLLSISLVNISIDDALKDVDFKYQLLRDGNIIEEGTGLDFTGNSFEFTSKEVIYSGDVNNFTFRVWIRDNGLDQNDMQNKVFSGSIEVNAVKIRNTGDSGGSSSSNTLYSIMASNAVLDTDIDFSKISSDTNGKGIYKRSGTENDTYPIYYYRGAVDNNNVLFADMCFKIVRTTETGGVKLIYNGVSSNGSCNNTGSSSQIGTKAFNFVYTPPAYVGYMYGTIYRRTSKSMSSVTDTYYYGNDVTYSGGTYTLVDTISSSSWSSIYNGGLNNNHYTCLGGTSCSSVYYIHYTTSSTMYYITLTNGKTVEDALSDMLDNNTTSSIIKGNSTTSGTLDYWYYTNIEQTGYSSYIEDTIWCNDRSIYQINGWNPDGGSTRSYLYFGAYGRAHSAYSPSLSCERETDRFTVSSSNGNGALDYPVGLITADEVMLAGGKRNTSNSSYYLNTGSYYWAGSPYYFSNDYASVFCVNSTGNLNRDNVNFVRGVRPSISLQPGTVISGGDGSVDSPYIIKTS